MLYTGGGVTIGGGGGGGGVVLLYTGGGVTIGGTGGGGVTGGGTVMLELQAAYLIDPITVTSLSKLSASITLDSSNPAIVSNSALL